MVKAKQASEQNQEQQQTGWRQSTGGEQPLAASSQAHILEESIFDD